MRKLIVTVQRWFESLSPTQKNEFYICVAAIIGLVIGIII